eukprot:GFYU01003699.1.p1 GENE.GFYU01003699.1~~GFYU01003699.1.p1  ORF type:complete len:253 (-),score=56.86 GFYU01003699.1:126-884(-)
MADKWLQDFETTRQLADDVQVGMVERQQTLREGGSVAKASAVLRRNMELLGKNLEKLQEQLQALSAKGAITEREATRRKDMISSLKTRKDYLVSTMRETATGPDRNFMIAHDTREAQQKSQGQWSTHAAYSGRGDMERGMNNEELILYQRQTIQDQDRSLDLLSRTIGNTKEIGLAIGDELDLHKNLLDDIDRGVDHNRDKMAKESSRMAKITRKSKSTGLFCCMVLLIVLFIVLAATDWGCKIVKPNNECN